MPRGVFQHFSCEKSIERFRCLNFQDYFRLFFSVFLIFWKELLLLRGRLWWQGRVIDLGQDCLQYCASAPEILQWLLYSCCVSKEPCDMTLMSGIEATATLTAHQPIWVNGVVYLSENLWIYKFRSVYFNENFWTDTFRSVYVRLHFQQWHAAWRTLHRVAPETMHVYIKTTSTECICDLVGAYKEYSQRDYVSPMNSWKG